MLIPTSHELEHQSGVPARSVLLPIAHATTLAGSATLIGTSSNLIIASLAAPSRGARDDVLVVPIAVPVALVGRLVLLITAPLQLRGRPDTGERDMSWHAESGLVGGQRHRTHSVRTGYSRDARLRIV